MPEEELQEDVQPKSKKKKLLVILVVLIACLGGGAFFVLSNSSINAETEESKAIVEKKEVVYCVVQEPFIINLRDSGTGAKKHFVKLKITFELFGRNEDCDILFKDMPKIRDVFTMYIRELREADLTAAGGGMYSLKEELLKRVFDIAREGVELRDVLLSDFVLS